MKVLYAGLFFILSLLPASADPLSDASASPQGHATIRGDIKTGFIDNTETHVVAIDGQGIYGAVEPCNKLSLSPGPHSIAFARDWTFLPLRIDAEPGADYVIRNSDDDDFVTVVDDRTGQSISKIAVKAAKSADRYAPPAGNPADLAVLKPVSQKTDETLFGTVVTNALYIMAVDGHVISGHEDLWAKRPSDATSIAIQPGTRAVFVGLFQNLGMNLMNYKSILAWTYIPLLVDARPGATYLLKYELPVNVPLRSSYAIVWVEDEAQNKVVVPRTRLLLNVYDGRMTYFAGVPVDETPTFPDGKGQLKRTPPKPKPWCQRD